jgi:hypothetical protein
MGMGISGLVLASCDVPFFCCCVAGSGFGALSAVDALASMVGSVVSGDKFLTATVALKSFGVEWVMPTLSKCVRLVWRLGGTFGTINFVYPYWLIVVLQLDMRV